MMEEGKSLIRDLHEQGRTQLKNREFRGIRRDKTKEAYYELSGESGESSWRSIKDSCPQMKVALVGVAYWVIGSGAYIILANLLVYITFHHVSDLSPSYPGTFHGNETRESMLEEYKNTEDYVFRRELYDVGFHHTPDWSHRPFILKLFMDVTVGVSQLLAPLALLYMGRTQNFVCYTATLMCITIMKGMMQLVTILPSANKGEVCWVANFGTEKLNTIQNSNFHIWLFESWGAAHGCNDMLWSGHTAQSAVGFLFLNNCLRGAVVPLCVRSLLVIIFALYMMCLLTLRMHYSIDVLCAVLIATLMYTHSHFRHFVWYWSNQCVGNEAIVRAASDPAP